MLWYQAFFLRALCSECCEFSPSIQTFLEHVLLEKCSSTEQARICCFHVILPSSGGQLEESQTSRNCGKVTGKMFQSATAARQEKKGVLSLLSSLQRNYLSQEVFRFERQQKKIRKHMGYFPHCKMYTHYFEICTVWGNVRKWLLILTWNNIYFASCGCGYVEAKLIVFSPAGTRWGRINNKDEALLHFQGF